VLTDGAGGPLAVIVAPANRHDSQLLEQTIEAVVVPRPTPEEVEENLCLDKAYDNPSGEAAAAHGGYTPHIHRIGEDAKPQKKHPGAKPRRWVVERTIAWLNKCRAILVRYNKHAQNYLGLIQLACSLIWYRRKCQLLNEPVLG
jgi:putative transposase